MKNSHFSKAKWIKATAGGWAISIILVLLLAGIFDAIGVEGMQFFMGVGMGAGVGIMQWRILKRTPGIGASWIWASIAGMGLPFLLFDLLKLLTTISLGPYNLLYSTCIAGLLTGWLQYLILRRHAPGAARWIVATSIGWLAATLMFLCVNYTKTMFSNNWLIFAVNMLLMLGGGPVLGWVTGTAMYRILANRKIP